MKTTTAILAISFLVMGTMATPISNDHVVGSAISSDQIEKRGVPKFTYERCFNRDGEHNNGLKCGGECVALKRDGGNIDNENPEGSDKIKGEITDRRKLRPLAFDCDEGSGKYTGFLFENNQFMRTDHQSKWYKCDRVFQSKFLPVFYECFEK